MMEMKNAQNVRRKICHFHFWYFSYWKVNLGYLGGTKRVKKKRKRKRKRNRKQNKTKQNNRKETKKEEKRKKKKEKVVGGLLT